MTIEQASMWYIIIGMIYAFINGFIRKIDTGGDYLLPWFWLFLWPLAFIGLGIQGIMKLKHKFNGGIR